MTFRSSTTPGAAHSETPRGPDASAMTTSKESSVAQLLGYSVAVVNWLSLTSPTLLDYLVSSAMKTKSSTISMSSAPIVALESDEDFWQPDAVIGPASSPTEPPPPNGSSEPDGDGTP